MNTDQYAGVTFQTAAAVVGLTQLTALAQYSPTVEELLKKIDLLEKKVEELSKNKEQTVLVHEDSEEAIRACVEKYIDDLPDGYEVYPSDIASIYSLDADAVESVMDKMYEEGLFR